MYGLLLQTYNTSYGYDDNSVERIIIPVGINECAKKSHSKKKRKRIIKGPTGATGLNGPQGFTGEMGTTGASGSTGLSGGGAILSFGTAGILNLDLATDNSSFTLGFASAYSGSILVGQDINMPGAMYIRVPRSGILQNLYLAVQIYIPPGPNLSTTKICANVYNSSGFDNPSGGPMLPNFNATNITTTISLPPTIGTPNTGANIFASNSDTSDMCSVAAGDFIAIRIITSSSTPFVSTGFMATISVTLELISNTT